MSIDVLLTRLEGVRSTRPGHWIARCPAHDDRSPSLAVRQLDDGRILMRCFAGCDTGAVLEAIGLRFPDLFPQHLGEYGPQRRPFDPLQVLLALGRELLVCDLIVCDVEQSGIVTTEQRERLHVAAVRFSNVIAAMGDRPVPNEIRRIRQAVTA